MPGSHLRNVSAEYCRSFHPGLHGGHSIREIIAAEEENADFNVFKERGDMPKRWAAVFDVSRWGHAEKSHNRGSCTSTANQE